MRLYKTLFQVIGIGAALAATPVFAQASFTLKASVPYSFQAGELHMPAGDYLIHYGSSVLWFQSTDTGKMLILTAGAPVRFDSVKKPELRFRVYENKHYLASIWSPAHDSGRELKRSRAEQEAASSGVPYKVAVLRVILQ